MMRIRSRKSTCPRVALLIETSRSYGRDLLIGIAHYIRAHGPWSIEFQEGDLGEVLPDWFSKWKGDGVIARIKTGQIATALSKRSVPVVDLYGGLRNLSVPVVRSNEAAVGRAAAEHLLERGFRQFAFCGFNGTDWSDCRRAGFLDAIAEARFPCQVFENPQKEFPTSLEYEEHGIEFERQLYRWLKALPKPMGLMACNDARGRQVLNACQQSGISVPDEVAVVGVDKDEVFGELSSQPLSSVILNTRRIGHEAAALLDRMMAGEPAPTTPVLIDPLGIATRRSSDVLAVEDANLVKALRFIRENAGDDFNVNQVAAYAGISRSVLQRRFQSIFGRSIHEEIIRVRIKRACDLLSGTDLDIADVAEKSGFKHREYLGAVFKRRLGKSPAQFRNEAARTRAPWR